MRRLALAAIAAFVLASPAAAATRIFSYDPVSPDAKRLTGQGLTFLFETRLLGGGKVRKIMATAVPAAAEVKPAGIGPLKGAEIIPADLYEIDASKAQGKVYVRAFCPGSTRVWLAVGTLRHGYDLKVQVLGDDPAGGPARTCASMDFAFRGEWRLPAGSRPDPFEEPFDSSLRF
ncbi:hypothetical protein [Caulobacter sp. NIBR2454]|uniref:hypothetical protein n=1 Tax=Caulobacter sp. NIBR2454 TaxID=3015996 RepID=UPI0022B5F5CA|nr:hypothetical protein [Caulobacter sp. NIBR2454]